MLDFSFPEKLTLGISQCLLGDAVRYDGSHKHSKLCTEHLSKRFSFIAVCPEVGIGLGTPRETISLRGSMHDEQIRVIGNRSADLDVTEKLLAYARLKAESLSAIYGYVFMGRSPSCGLGNVKVYLDNGHASGKSSAGLYAREFTRLHPLLPVEEEGRLRDARLCENFVARVYAWKRWNDMLALGLTSARLQEFHARHKYLLMSHRVESYRHLGRLVAQAHLRPLQVTADEYIHEFMATLKIGSSNRSHTNVLQHLAGYLKNQLDAASRQELQQLIDNYRQGLVPLIAPMTLLKHHFRQHPNSYIQQQVYLEPHPPELMLRNF
ncbi:MAG: YbgA family protein [Moraxellaceae bacterium]